MACNRMPFQKEFAKHDELCQICRGVSLHATQAYGLNTLDLSTLESPELIASLESILKSAPENLYDFTYDGIEFGNLGAFEVCVGMKRSRLENSDPGVREAWLLLIESALKSYLMVKEAIVRHDFTHVAYFNDYSINLAAGLAAERHGAIPMLICQASHRNVDRRRCIVYKRCSATNVFTVAARWEKWRGIPISRDIVNEISEDSFTRFSGIGSHIFSPPKGHDFDAGIGHKKSARRIVAFTSSPDEWAGARVMFKALNVSMPEPHLTFGGTIENCHAIWLKRLSEYCSGREDIELIIRIHPREGITKQDNMPSTHLSFLQETLVNLPDNCRVVWPQESVSSYDLGENADLVLTSWSTIGAEMARLGAPVLCSNFGVSGFVADDFLEFAETEQEYFVKLEQLLLIPPSLARMKRAYRWWNLLCLSGSVDLSDVIPAPDFCDLPEFRVPERVADLESAFLGDSNIFDINHARLMASQNQDSEKDETLALMQECRRILRYLLTSRPDEPDSLLMYVQSDGSAELLEAALKSASQRGVELIFEENRLVTFFSGNGSIVKFSPMVARLAFLGCSYASVDDSLAPELTPFTERIKLPTNLK